jgi:hypothetical protein
MAFNPKTFIVLCGLALPCWLAAGPTGCGGDDVTPSDGADTDVLETEGGGDVPGDEGRDETASEGDVPPVDEDGDGYPVGEDCDDTNFEVNPGATELCNGIDDDCDTETDEEGAAEAPIWYADADGDTFGDPESTRQACTAPTGYVEDHTDCDDGDEEVNPDAVEVCNSTDDNCDTVVDESTATDARSYYPDVDADTFGDAAGTATPACPGLQPTGYIEDHTDCDDDDSLVNPTAAEQCNGIDDNCDGITDDDGTEAVDYYLDSDGDGFGAGTATHACPGWEPADYVANSSDCDDTDPTRYPGALDEPDTLNTDTDCDGIDGAAGHSIFLSAGAGADSNDGRATPDGLGGLVIHPVRTLAHALVLASATGDGYCDGTCDVLVATGTYDVGAAPVDLIQGVDIHGGYVGAGWNHTGLVEATLITGSSGTAVLRASGLTEDTVVSFLRVQGATMTTPGESSTAMLVQNTPTIDRLQLRYVEIVAGRGGPGANGAAGGVVACAECQGGAGGVGWIRGDYCECDSAGKGGFAGAATAADGFTCPSPGAGGTIGNGANCSPSGSCSCNTAGMGNPGQRGGHGVSASPGGAPAGDTLGRFTGSAWSADPGGNGRDGSRGAGGGGGGTGGTDRRQTPCPAARVCGGAGGAGGSGGCGGVHGTGGGAGGASLGLVLIASQVTLDHMTVFLGRGGDGGSGGGGGNGAVGSIVPADGLLGYENNSGGCTYRGGTGGTGGLGGFGGGGSGGAGGNGGPSVAIALVGLTAQLNGTAPAYNYAGALGGFGGTYGLGGLRGDGERAAMGTAGFPGVIRDSQRF